MRSYQNKDELKAEIKKTFEKYITEFSVIPEDLKDLRVEEVDRTPAENLAYQVGWTSLLLQWEQEERMGRSVQTPMAQFQWNQLGELYQWFYQEYAPLTLATLTIKLHNNVDDIMAWVDYLSEEECFQPHQRKWADAATKSAVWPVYKFIHINTVAPFGTFRTKIRKWKKLAL